MKIISPIIAAVMAVINTAPAAKSFTLPIFSFHSGDTTSESFSMAVLNVSAANTDPMQMHIIIHSIWLMSKKNPAITTRMAAARCIQALCSANSHLIPFAAYTKLLALFLRLNDSFFCCGILRSAYLFNSLHCA